MVNAVEAWWAHNLLFSDRNRGMHQVFLKF